MVDGYLQRTVISLQFIRTGAGWEYIYALALMMVLEVFNSVGSMLI